MADIEAYVHKLLEGEITGGELSSLQSKGILSKGERRSIMKKLAKSRSRSGDTVAKDSQSEGNDGEPKEGSVTMKSNKRKEMDSSSDIIEEKERTLAIDESGGTEIDAHAGNSSMTSKQKKNAIKLLNKELNTCALKKQLHEAKKKVRAALKKNLMLDVHSYTNLINCYARCGDVRGAQQTLEGMIKAGVSPNVVTWTALLKGCCDNGDLHSGRSIFLYDMLQLVRKESLSSDPLTKKAKKVDKAAVDQSLYPNERSLATLLRGCQRVGAISLGLECFQTWFELTSRLKGKGGGSGGNDEEGWGGDTASLYVISMCAQKLAMEDACTLAGSLLGLRLYAESAAALKPTLEQASAALSLSRGYAVMGMSKEAQAWAETSSTCVKQSKSSSLLKAMQYHGNAPVKPPRSGGAPASASASASASSSSSNGGTHLYQTHQRLEIEAELAAMQPYLAAIQGVTQADTHRAALEDQLGKFLVVGHDGRGDLHDSLVTGPAVRADTAVAAATAGGGVLTARHLYQALMEKCGLAMAGRGRTEELRAAVEKRLQRNVTAEGIIHFPQVFSSSSSSARCERPLKLEVGAGAGEWAVAQAAADGASADWIALELRCDRAYQIFCRQLFSVTTAAVAAAQRRSHSHSRDSDTSTCSNLSVIAGDAGKVMHNNIDKEAVSAIFVNHPEPPERSMLVDKRTGVGKSSSKVQGKHMLTDAFFVNCGRILKEGGTVSIVTDSLPYAKLLTEIIASLPVQDGHFTFESVDAGDDSDNDDKNVGHGVSVEKVEMRKSNVAGGSVVLWRGEPGPTCGHSIIASSYFDRLWDKGNKKRRWFLYLRKMKCT